MIGKLTGKIDSIHGSQMILDVSGVGYLVSCSAHTQRLAGVEGDTAMLWIESQIREDAFNLFGFADTIERDWFRLLTSVQGVGAKAGLAILSILSPERLGQAIAAGDKASLTAADGIGPKIANRLLTELKDKVAHLSLPPSSGAANDSSASVLPHSSMTDDAMSALLHLGYRRMEAFSALSSASTSLGEEVTLDSLIRTALSNLSKHEGTA